MGSHVLPVDSIAGTTGKNDRWHRPHVAFAAAMALLAVVSAVGLAVDHRTVVGAPAWLKPLKFAISLGLYAVTVAWMLRIVPRGRRAGWWLGTLIAVAGTAEFAAIVLQAVRGRASHFNVSTPFDSNLFALMGIMAGLFWVATFGLALVLSFQRHDDRATALAIRFGLGLSLLGMLVGVLMLGPTPEQQRAIDSGTRVTTAGAHSVGVPDGGPSMPLTGWSTTGGDLRIPHFFGIHAVQALPLLALLLLFLAGRSPAGRFAVPAVRARLVWIVGIGYAGGLALLTWQAERGQSLLRPDPLTLGAAGGLAVAVLVAAVAVLARREPPPPLRKVPDHAAETAQLLGPRA